MRKPGALPAARDRLLFTPGPLTTSPMVKQAMLRDLGSRDEEFVATVRGVRDALLGVAGVARERGYEAVLLPGSGTSGVEAVLTSVVPPTGRLLILTNGAYGERMARIASVHGIAHSVLAGPIERPSEPDEVERRLAEEISITTVAMVHCETTTGIVNPVDAIGPLVRSRGRRFIVDAMSSFGALPIDLQGSGVDYLVSTPNKCLEAVPGFAIVLCDRDALLETGGWARTLSLDLFAQWQGFEADGQFRFTPPVQAILALEAALRELEIEGGPESRAERYRRNQLCLARGMRHLGFEEYLRPEFQSPIITTFRCPMHPRFQFSEFYRRLNDLGFVIYPGKVPGAECFRIGTIGRLFECDVEALLSAIRETLARMGC